MRPVHAQALHERLPHVDADGPDESAAPAGQGLGEEPVQRLAFALAAQPDRLAGFEITDDGQERELPEEQLVHAQVAPGRPRPAGHPAAQDPLIRRTVSGASPHLAATGSRGRAHNPGPPRPPAGLCSGPCPPARAPARCGPRTGGSGLGGPPRPARPATAPTADRGCAAPSSCGSP